MLVSKAPYAAMRAPRAQYLDFSCAYLIAENKGIELHCRCGRTRRLTPDNSFKQQPESSLHPIIAAARCSQCGVLGHVFDIRVISLNNFAHNADR